MVFQAFQKPDSLLNVKRAFMGNPSVERHRCTDCIVTQVTVAVIVFTDLTSVSVSYASGDGKIKKNNKKQNQKVTTPLPACHRQKPEEELDIDYIKRQCLSLEASREGRALL